MDFLIREATLKDSEQMGYVHYTAWLETYTGKIDNSYLNKLSVHRSVNMFQRIGCKNHFVLIIDNEIVGFVGSSKARDEDLSDDYGEIQGIYILKKYQGYGFGKELLKKAVGELSKQGFEKVILWVLDKNNKAISFYERFGFIYEGKSKTEILVKPIKELRFIYTIKNNY